MGRSAGHPAAGHQTCRLNKRIEDVFMDRRSFLESTTSSVTTAGAATPLSAAAPAALAQTTSIPQTKAVGEPVTRRWLEQRRVIDNVIKANGIDWGEPRRVYLNGPCGFDADGDFAAIRLPG
jgi:secreted PhoX family phosphatase